MNDHGSTTITSVSIIDSTSPSAPPRSPQSLFDVRVEGGVVSHVVRAGSSLPASSRTLEGRGCFISPGFVDLHVHLREPGQEESETIETGSRAAARGGFTAIVAMPNTEPTQDSRAVVEFVRSRASEVGLCDVLPAGAITLARAGEVLSPMAELRDAGVQIFTDDGNGVQDPLVMRRAMEYAVDLDLTLAQHCEITSLTRGAVMHEGSCCSRLGLPGWPSIAEELMVHRDIELARLTGARVHFLHLSTAGSVELVRRAKASGVRVTAEAAPHHFSLTDELLESFDPVFKVNPPLRTASDIAAIKEGLRDGTIDAIATDHAPHAEHLKETSLDAAPPGMLGLETSLALSLTELDMPIVDIIAALSWKPAQIAGVGDRHGRPVAPGEPAHLVVFDPNEAWTVRSGDLASKSRNTPYAGRKLVGRVRHTLYRGEPVVVDSRSTR